MSERREPVEVTLPNGVKMRFCHIPAGTARMGQRGEETAEEPVTEVRVGEFWMGETPVTQEQFAAWRVTGDYERWFEENGEIIKKSSWDNSAELHENQFKGQAKNPADSVTWWEGRAFGEWLKREGVLADFLEKSELPRDGGWHFDLPEEAQWECACRAEAETEYWSGDGAAALEEVGWFSENSENKTHPVGEKQLPNGNGLHDLHGNVFEWCREDWDGEKATSRLRVPGEAEPRKRSDEGEAEYRVLRGGSWDDTAAFCRAAYRFWFRPGLRFGFFGFRLAVVPGPSSQDKRPEAQQEVAEPRAVAVEARDEPEQAQAEGGADLNTNFRPRSGDDFQTNKENDDE